jgi:hypothetical protein
MTVEARGLGPMSINVRITAVRKLAVEAADNGLLAPELATRITRVKGVASKGVRLGNWLSAQQAQKLRNAPVLRFTIRAAAGLHWHSGRYSARWKWRHSRWWRTPRRTTCATVGLPRPGHSAEKGYLVCSQHGILGIALHANAPLDTVPGDSIFAIAALVR